MTTRRYREKEVTPRRFDFRDDWGSGVKRSGHEKRD